MRLFVILALCAFWIVLSVRSFQRGDVAMGVIFIVVGLALTAYRLMKQ